jgi:hypothetical protein
MKNRLGEIDLLKVTGVPHHMNFHADTVCADLEQHGAKTGFHWIVLLIIKPKAIIGAEAPNIIVESYNQKLWTVTRQ